MAPSIHYLLILISGGDGANRLAVFVDKNRDLFIYSARSSVGKTAKLGTMVQTMLWHDQAAMIAAMCNGKFTIWYFPGIVFVDPDILSMTRHQSDATDLGKAPMCVLPYNDPLDFISFFRSP